MIVDRPESHFIFIFPKAHVYQEYNYINYKGTPLTNKEYLTYWGKWLVFGTRKEFDRLAQKMSPLVDSHDIPAVKYDREMIPAFELGECVMCVYCDERQRDEVWKILNSLGVEDKAWVYEKRPWKDGFPEAIFLKKWIKSHNLTKEQADSVREGSILRFKDMFEDENAIFKGVEQ